MATWRKAILAAAAALVLVLGAGYLTAWKSLSACADETYQEIRRLGISGTDIQGNKVGLSRNNVSARIAGPFLVEVQYLVPYDLHGTLHVERYLALPWRTAKRSSEAIQLVTASASPSRLSANNSFKPKPLRGSA